MFFSLLQIVDFVGDLIESGSSPLLSLYCLLDATLDQAESLSVSPSLRDGKWGKSRNS